MDLLVLYAKAVCFEFGACFSIHTQLARSGGRHVSLQLAAHAVALSPSTATSAANARDVDGLHYLHSLPMYALPIFKLDIPMLTSVLVPSPAI
jgi:hypothetical protein